MDFPQEYFRAEVRDGFYVDGMLKRAWAEGIEVLNVIDEICSKHHITWYADNGTLLGAVRHGGYIPWDDDVDICMMRDDFMRFREIVERYFVSASVGELSEEMLAEIIDALGAEDYAIKPLLSALYELGKEAGESKTYVEGESNLLAYKDTYGDISELIRFLQQRDQLSRLVSFSESKDNSRMSILIGSENVFDELGDSSMILSRYAFGDNAMGTIGIIGPTRIDYARLIPDVQYLTDMVGRLLAEHYGEDEE